MHTPGRALVPASVLRLLANGRAWFHDAFADATIEQYRARQTELIASSQSIIAQADSEGREMQQPELTQVAGNSGEVERLDNEIATRERVLAQASRLSNSSRRTAAEATQHDEEEDVETLATIPAQRGASSAFQPQNQQRSVITVPARARGASAAGTAGFRNFGDFATAVRRASHRGGDIDMRLTNAAASSLVQESVGADGGFMVPIDFRSDILGRVFAEDSLVGRCDQQTCSGNVWTAPTDETTPWGTGGIRAYWESEANSITQSKPSLREVSVRLHKLAALVPVTEEMLEDAGSIDGYLRSKIPEALDWQISTAIVRGTGVGQPLGFSSGAALVTVAAEGSQVADTLVAGNIAKMYARMPLRSIPTSVWLIHPDAQPQLYLMTLGGTTQASPIYAPPGGFSQSPFGTLMGRPVIPHQVCATVGDVGDIFFVDLAQYLVVRKAGGMTLNTSMHLWFDQDLTAYKVTMRIAGQPWWSAGITQRSGTNVQSPYVTLAAR